MSGIEAVFFDVGETMVDKTREYGTWADWLGVPRHTFSAVFGVVIARGGDYRETFQYFRPGFDLATERERRAEAGQPETFGEENLYPDARPCLGELRRMGLRVGLAGNQTARAERILKSLHLPEDVIGTSDGWGVEKPSPAFFARVVEEAGCAAGSVLYVGDRLDNDIRPAQQCRKAHVPADRMVERRRGGVQRRHTGQHTRRDQGAEDPLAAYPTAARPTIEHGQ